MSLLSTLGNFFSKLNGAIQHIFPPIITIVYLTANYTLANEEWMMISCFIISALCIAGYGYLLNDICDVKMDIKAGKKNMVAGMPNVLKALLLLLLVSVGLTIYYWGVNTQAGFYLLIIQFLLLLVYSAPPLRLKRFPITGPLLDAHYGHVVPVFIALYSFHLKLDIWHQFALYGLLLFKGLRNILNHQVADRKIDREFSIHTFPNFMGPLRTVLIIHYLMIPFEIILLIINLLFVNAWSQIPLISFAIFILYHIFLFSAWKFGQKELKRELTFKFLYFLNDYYEYWIPLICIWLVPLHPNQQIILTIIHLIIFNKTIPKIWKDFRKIGINLKIVKE